MAYGVYIVMTVDTMMLKVHKLVMLLVVNGDGYWWLMVVNS